MSATGIAFAVGGITAANELLFAPIAGGKPAYQNFNWRIIPATAVFAAAMNGMDRVAPRLGTGIAVIALVTVLFTQFGNANPPVINLGKALGYIK